MEKIRLGIIGFGNMGTAHAKNVRTGLVPKMELSAICDIFWAIVTNKAILELKFVERFIFIVSSIIEGVEANRSNSSVQSLPESRWFWK